MENKYELWDVPLTERLVRYGPGFLPGTESTAVYRHESPVVYFDFNGRKVAYQKISEWRYNAWGNDFFKYQFDIASRSLEDFKTLGASEETRIRVGYLAEFPPISPPYEGIGKVDRVKVPVTHINEEDIPTIRRNLLKQMDLEGKILEFW